MGIISLINSDRMFWLGRYTERVYTTIRLFYNSFDALIDNEKGAYRKFCEQLEIPCFYESGDDFVERYCFDPDDPNSLISNLTRAYDNAITLRETIGSETLAYVQLAMYALNGAKGDQAPILQLQKVLDNLLAFWGIVEDSVDDETSRNIIKTGKRLERLDLYARMHSGREELIVAFDRLAFRLRKTDLPYEEENLKALEKYIKTDELDYDKIVLAVETLV